jgi:replicative DNA helicase
MLSRQALADVQDTGLAARDFYAPAHELAFMGVQSLAGRGDPVDVNTVVAELRTAGVLARVGGPVGVSDMVSSTVTSANAGYYARTVQSLAVLRRLAETGMRIAQLGLTGLDGHGGGAVEDVVAEAWTHMQSVESGGAVEVTTFADVAEKAIDSIGTRRFHPTPWAGLNHLIGGWQPEYLYGLGARPGQGKTVLAVQAAVDMARSGRGVAYYTFEMSGPRLYQRALAGESGVAGSAIQSGTLSDAQWRAIAAANDRLEGLPFVVQDAAGWTAAQVHAHARAAARKHPLGLVVVDHVGRVRPAAGSRQQSKEQQVAEAANLMLDLAHQQDCSVLLVTQLNRQPTQRADQRPVTADVRDSDVIEQNCDVLMLMYRDVENSPDDLDLAVGKNRDGVCASVRLSFDGALSKVSDRAWRPHHALDAS